jgi:hypothetical protein
LSLSFGTKGGGRQIAILLNTLFEEEAAPSTMAGWAARVLQPGFETSGWAYSSSQL